MMWRLLCFILSKIFLSSPHCFKLFLFSALCLGVFYTLPSKTLIQSSASSNLLFIPSSVLFISDIAFFIFDSSFLLFLCLFHAVEYACNHSSKLYVINCLCPFHLVLLLETSLVLSFVICFFVFPFWLLLCTCLCILNRSAKTLV